MNEPSEYSDPGSPYRHYVRRIEERNPKTGRFDLYIVWDSYFDRAATTEPADRKAASIIARNMNKRSKSGIVYKVGRSHHA